MPPSRPGILDDLSLLYELSLAIGTSLDLQENCAHFLNTLLARKNLDYAALWIRTDRLGGEGGAAGGFRLAYANPMVLAPRTYLPR